MIRGARSATHSGARPRSGDTVTYVAGDTEVAVEVVGVEEVATDLFMRRCYTLTLRHDGVTIDGVQQASPDDPPTDGAVYWYDLRSAWDEARPSAMRPLVDPPVPRADVAPVPCLLVRDGVSSPAWRTSVPRDGLSRVMQLQAHKRRPATGEPIAASQGIMRVWSVPQCQGPSDTGPCWR